jgi:hypothetical protein
MHVAFIFSIFTLLSISLAGQFTVDDSNISYQAVDFSYAGGNLDTISTKNLEERLKQMKIETDHIARAYNQMGLRCEKFIELVDYQVDSDDIYRYFETETIEIRKRSGRNRVEKFRILNELRVRQSEAIEDDIEREVLAFKRELKSQYKKCQEQKRVCFDGLYIDLEELESIT